MLAPASYGPVSPAPSAPAPSKVDERVAAIQDRKQKIQALEEGLTEVSRMPAQHSTPAPYRYVYLHFSYRAELSQKQSQDTL
jgi:hypothetical protein